MGVKQAGKGRKRREKKRRQKYLLEGKYGEKK